MKIYNYFKNIAEENIYQEFRLKNIDETRNYLVEELNGNELMSRKDKKVCTTLNYIEQFLILGSAITRRASTYFFGRYSYRNYKFCNLIKKFVQ